MYERREVGVIAIQSVYNEWKKSPSQNTVDAKTRIANDFFMHIAGKPVEKLEEKDLAIDSDYVEEKFITPLRKEGVKDSSIKHYLSVVQSLYQQLNDNGLLDSSKISFKIALSDKMLDDDSEVTKLMTYQDYKTFKYWLEFERFNNNRNADLGKKYAMLLEFMWTTSSRIAACFNVKWTDIKREYTHNDVPFWRIYIKDKGNKTNKKNIGDKFHDKLKKIMYNGDDNEKIFACLSQRGFSNYMKEFFEPRGKDLTPHSVRKGTITWYYHQTKDIIATKEFADHENIQTTQHYIDASADPFESAEMTISMGVYDKYDAETVVDELDEELFLRILRQRPDLVSSLGSEIERLKR